jgi:anti-sigma-K factor RskA
MRENKCNQLLDYMNGQLSDEEAAEFEQHLTSCSVCKEELEELQVLMRDLPYASEPITPPATMKERVLEQVFAAEQETERMADSNEEEQPVRKMKGRTRRVALPVLAAALAASLLGNAYLVLNERETGGGDSLEEQTVEVEETRQTIELAASNGAEAQGQAAIVGQKERIQLIVQAANLEALEGEETYQVWLLKDGVPSRAGTFLPDNEGKGAVSFSLEEEQTWDTVAITKEPTATSKTPQGDILLSAPLT